MKLNTKSSIAIVKPKSPTPRENFAAEELQKYLSMIFPGLYAYILTDEDSIADDKILIGGPERNKLTANYITEKEFDVIAPGPEGMYINASGEDTLILAGSSKNLNEMERGTVYAVYELLERYLGCAFGAYFHPEYAGGELVSALEEVDLTGISYIKASCDNLLRAGAVEYFERKVNHIHNLKFFDWMAKNRFNCVSVWMHGYEKLKRYGLLKELDRRGIQLGVGSHDIMPTMLPWEGNDYFPERYYETHPEYYRLCEDGSRFKPDPVRPNFGSLPFCNRNPELVEVLSENILYWLEKNPTVNTLGFLPMDGKRDQCTCPECSKYTKIENYTYLTNAIARRIGKVRPDVTISMLLYVDLWEHPEGLVMEPNVRIPMCVWHHTGLRKIGAADGSCIVGTFYERDMIKWIESGAKTTFSDYYMGVHGARQRYIPAADEIQAYYKMCMRIGAQGIGTQMEYYNFWNHIFNFYTFGRTGYDSELSFEDNLNNFVKIFGEGGAYVAGVIRIAEATLEGQEIIKKAGLYLMAHIDKEACYELYEKALAAATTPAARNNIRMMRMEFRYSDIECTYTTYLGEQGMIYDKWENCKDPTGELYYMSRNYDSCKWNNPGFAIMLPLDCDKQADYIPDHWYDFEK